MKEDKVRNIVIGMLSLFPELKMVSNEFPSVILEQQVRNRAMALDSMDHFRGEGYTEISGPQAMILHKYITDDAIAINVSLTPANKLMIGVAY